MNCKKMQDLSGVDKNKTCKKTHYEIEDILDPDYFRFFIAFVQWLNSMGNSCKSEIRFF